MKDKPLIYIIGGSTRNRADEDIIIKHVKRIGMPFFETTV